MAAAQPNKQLNIYQRINEVRRSNPYIKKEKIVDGQYKVVTHDQVTAELRDDLVKYGVVIQPYLVDVKTVQDTGIYSSSRRSPIIRVEGIVDVFFVNVDNPEDRVCVRVPAHALDSGDKGPGKLMSYAVKMAMLKVFSIETGEDDEEREERDAIAASITVNEYNAFVEAINGLKFSEKLDSEARSLYGKILESCGKVKDRQSAVKLRALLTTKVKQLKEKEGAASA